MKQTVNFYNFTDAFASMGRESNFSYEALGLLFNFFEELEACSDEEMELDVIGICCDYCEMTLEEYVESYSPELPDEYDIDTIVEILENVTCFVGKTEQGTVVFQAY